MATIQDLGKVAYFNKGAYNSQTNYEINDVVSYNGSSYVSLDNNNQGNLPTNTTYWSVVALKGDKGDTGKPFVIEKTYESIEDMVADYDNMQVNDYVMIQGNIEEEENATLWTKTDTEVSPYKWVYLADFSGASGITGATPNIQIGTVTEGNEPAVTRRAGSTNENPILDFVLKTGATGATGATGNGISSVSKTSTSGLTDTYTIEYTSGNSTTYNVTNGKGIASVTKTGSSGLVDTYTITYNDGTTSTYTITNGEDGEVTQEQLDETNSEIELLKKIYNAFPTTSNENESITLNGTAEVQFKKIKLEGNTSQNTTQGNQLLDFSNPSAYTTGGTYTFTNDILTFSTTSDNGTYTNARFNVTDLYKSNAGKKLRFVFDSINTTNYGSGSITQLSINYNDSTPNAYVGLVNSAGESLSGATIPDDTTNVSSVDIRIYTNNANTTGNYSISMTKPMLQFGSESKNYEIFTGGRPSPNTDYPQNIEVVKGNNTILVESKNKFDIKDTNYKRLNTGTVTINNNNIIVENVSTTAHQFVWWNIPIMVGEEITISYNSLTESTSDNNNGVFYTFNDEPYTSFVSFDSFSKVDKTNKYSTTTATKKYLVIGLRTVPLCTNTLNKLQIEKGSIASEYEEYQGRQTYSINLGNMELCKAGDYQDYIYKENEKWYKYGVISNHTLDGSENNWNTLGGTTQYPNVVIYLRDNTFANSIENSPLYCNYFKESSDMGLIQTPETCRIAEYSNAQRFFAVPKETMTVEQFKTWLSTHNTIVYYAVKTPTITEITENTLIEQLNNIEKAYSYDTETNISQINEETPFIINAEAIMSLQNILN